MEIILHENNEKFMLADSLVEKIVDIYQRNKQDKDIVEEICRIYELKKEIVLNILSQKNIK